MKISLLVICVAFALFALASAETQCQQHKRNAVGSAHGLEWDIQCDEQGKYKPLQCTKEKTESKKWCSCYNEEEAITGPSRKMRYCQCPLARRQATDRDADTCDTPSCANTGLFQPKQCCPSTGKCHCVNPNTGEKTSEPTADVNLQCS